ncbi:hypothetical protein OOU_Y34scaffold00516g83 [Pyricularia oryzae Y34]|uniref:Uncharacterized protein n=3 Tax=Pyricularia oryzae TaxID=318829 RepID=A0A4P7ND05_PYROR|nr:hypothetical protein OOU_Y34scaffold00516g83 [Pyricularia oryzae Y34]QBZ59556.1 hypothetical protein PoMZ_04517 [Pyricularia oryzae]
MSAGKSIPCMTDGWTNVRMHWSMIWGPLEAK